VTKIRNIGLLALSILILASCSRTLETWQTNNGPLKVRITKSSGPGIFATGATYVFESSRNDDDWQEIATVSKDLSEPIDKENIQFVDDQVAFVYMRWMFAVTTNGGAEWTVWDAQDYKYSNVKIEWGVIKSVSINSDGIGEMMLWVFPSSSDCLALSSQDFGRTWVENGSIKPCSE